jgi:GR25 family glycosyltransferase involved in LPS biosynthesis
MSPSPGAVATPAGASGLPCPVIAISMRPAFWERLQGQLAGFGQHDAILCQSTDGNRIDVAAWVAQGRWQPPPDDDGRPMTRGELGCSDSHRRAWSYIVEAALPGALVLEDDADLPADLPQWVREAWQYRDRWEVLYLGHTGWAMALPIDGVPQFQIPLIAHAWNVTHAYLVTHDGARRLLRHALPIRSPVDVYMARLTVAGLLAWQSARPVVATRGDTYSSTQGIR